MKEEKVSYQVWPKGEQDGGYAEGRKTNRDEVGRVLVGITPSTSDEWFHWIFPTTQWGECD